MIVKKRQRRLGDVDEIVLSLYAKGLTTGEISAHFRDIYGASVSKETVSRITDKVVAEMEEWSSRPLDSMYVAIFIDALVVKVREGQVAERSFPDVRDGIFGGISRPDITSLFGDLEASTSYEQFSSLVRQAQGAAGLMRSGN